MKKILLTVLVGFILAATFNQSRAAFPVKQAQTVVVSSATSEKNAQIVSEQNLNEEAVAEAAAKQGGGKSQLVALLLCAFLGGLGIHRFYLGYIWQGIVQLLTGGGCGIWALIDFIRIITGSLQPKDGSYDKTL
jgi:TM2 domain-containing membrane protein YozV